MLLSIFFITFLPSLYFLILGHVVVCIAHFIQMVATKKGYLTFSIPTTTTKHLLSHLFVASFYSIIALLFVFTYLTTICFNTFSFFFPDFRLSEYMAQPSSILPAILIVFAKFLLLFLVSILFFTLIYTFIAIITQFKNQHSIKNILQSIFAITVVWIIPLLYSLPFFQIMESLSSHKKIF